MKKDCKICGKEFLDKTRNKCRKYCSQKCNMRAYYINGGKKTRYKYKSTEKGKKQQRDYYYRNKEIMLIKKHTRDNYKLKKRCEFCNSEYRLQFHHESYKPIKVLTLCHICHCKVHGKRSLL